MTKISFYVAMTAATIYIMLSYGLLVTAARENLPPTLPPSTDMNESREKVGPLCLSDGDCKHFCRPKKGVCNIDFETCVCS
ncbi:hypothetical protein CARUB_v10028092mg [Capsella rubella]|uniref:Uncharacterized protein n=1 Tax=Capsella rubella TaxID=81985 RepID=R0EZP2_9BRAS|nr:putative defensin-like protein 283 [Capsella rubella]EOA14792.1 hypothetical protein CARUB_v10028092mg [Capsella rubella]